MVPLVLKDFCDFLVNGHIAPSYSSWVTFMVRPFLRLLQSAPILPCKDVHQRLVTLKCTSDSVSHCLSLSQTEGSLKARHSSFRLYLLGPYLELIQGRHYLAEFILAFSEPWLSHLMQR